MAYSGATISAPTATHYSHASTGNSQARTFRADGLGSLIDLPGLTTITNGTHYNSNMVIKARSGGFLNLGNVSQIVETTGGDSNERQVFVTAEGAGSLVDLASLTDLEGRRGGDSSNVSCILADYLATVSLGSVETLLENTRVTAGVRAPVRNNMRLGAGSTLYGTGTVAGNVVNGSSVRPGTSPGTLTIEGDYTQEHGTLYVEIDWDDMQHDQFVATEDVVLASEAALNVSFSYSSTPTTEREFVIVRNDGPNAIAGRFAGLDDDEYLKVNGMLFQIDYDGGDGNDVVLIPLPGSSDTIDLG